MDAFTSLFLTVCLSKDWLLMLSASTFDGEERLVLYHYVIFHWGRAILLLSMLFFQWQKLGIFLKAFIIKALKIQLYSCET